MSDLISRADAISVLDNFTQTDTLGHTPRQIVEALPSAQPEQRMRDKIIDLLYAENVRSDCGIERLADEICAIDPARWIPVSDRLPEEEVQVLVTDDAGGLATIDVDCGYFDKEYGRFEWFHSQNVTAWMPLPEPYKEKNESQRLQV